MDMPAVMSKFLHLGMRLNDIVLKSTWAPAKAISRQDQLGTLRTGSIADLFVFDLEDGEFPLEDTHLRIEKAKRRIRPLYTVKSGELVECGSRKTSMRPLYPCDDEILRFVEENAG